MSGGPCFVARRLASLTPTAQTPPATVTATRAGGDFNRLNAPVEEMTGAGITSASYLKRSPAIPWSKAETEKFYDALTKYGTDFTLIPLQVRDRHRFHSLRTVTGTAPISP